MILCGGTRDIAKNEANIGLRHISQFANSTADTNVIVTCAPTRFDLQPSSCVNKEVDSFNRKLQKSMKIYSHVQVCSMNTNRNAFTTHGLHMNTLGKSWITNTWASIIKILQFSSLSTPPIPLAENKCYENNTMICIAQEETIVRQEVDPNVAASNEPPNCDLRASQPTKPSDSVSDNLTESVESVNDNPTEDTISLQEDSKNAQKTIEDIEVPTATSSPDEGLRLSKGKKKPQQLKMKIFYGEQQLQSR